MSMAKKSDTVRRLRGRFGFTPYFEDNVVNNPAREHLLPYIEAAIDKAEAREVQQDGKVRYFWYVEDFGHHIRVITTGEGRLFNAHEDSNYTRKKRRQKQ
ncbi:MAG: hypothetical protein K6T51_01170 [Rubrobacteraceae bacterium]|nr:hypothetical protein [Rubrobacteraceae bacterium]